MLLYKSTSTGQPVAEIATFAHVEPSQKPVMSAASDTEQLARHSFIQQKIDNGLLQLAYENNAANISVNLLAGLGVVSLLWQSSASKTGIWVCICLLLALSAVRAAGSWWAIRVSANFSRMSDDLRRRLKLYYAGGLLGGLTLWTVLTAMALGSGVAETKYSAIIIISALAAGATGILASQLMIGRAYVCIMLLQGSLQLLFDINHDYVLATLGIIFMIVMVITHRNNNAVLTRSLRLQFENDFLVTDLQGQQDALKELNSTLEERVHTRTLDLKHLAEHDRLTKVYNRSGIIQWVEDQWSILDRDLVYALIFLDLDRFKQINDGLGHAVGDCVLVEVANRLRGALPANSALCRWGGDEFIAVFAVSESEAIEAGHKLAAVMRSAVEDTITVSQRKMHVGFSAGLAISGLDPVEVSEAIRSADLAAGEVKRRGRGHTLTFSQDLAAVQERKLVIAQTLKYAISAGELSIVFQPIVSAKSLLSEAHEVLLRWDNPVLGRVSPDEFIGIAEETGDIVEIGNFVLDSALREFSNRRDRQAAEKIAVNVSLRQLIAPGLLETVQAGLQRYAVEPASLVLEVTESIFDERNWSAISTVLTELRKAGIEIHIDDFGTGYSSLSRLHEMPISALKIDKSFVQRMDGQARAIIEGSVLIAEKFGISTIAEGVETSEQAVLLQDMRVTYLQGYLFGKPEPFFCGLKNIDPLKLSEPDVEMGNEYITRAVSPR